MKNIYLFFIFLLLTGCGYNLALNNETIPVLCPSILFGSGHTAYIGSTAENISLDNIEYQGKINNALFTKKCTIKKDVFFSELSILFIVKPLIDEINLINLPFYVAILNQNKELQDILYFSALGKFNINLETNNAIETDITKILTIQHENINESSIIIIGYILDEKREEILN